MTNKFIVVEGSEGVGKSSQIKIIERYLIDNKIDYMNLDVEGHEMNVLKGCDLSLYKPNIISVEFLDLDMKYLEFKNNDFQRLVNSDLYKHLLSNNYHFINWLHGDLIFAHNDFRD